jgi:hypothetical protein
MHCVMSMGRRVRACTRLLVAAKALATRDHVRGISGPSTLPNSINGNDKVFSTDILQVEISGPSQLHLTMVNLPSLFLARNKDQTDEDAKLVETLVLSYMREPRSIVLAVVSAKSNFALQQVTQHA